MDFDTLEKQALGLPIDRGEVSLVSAESVALEARAILK
jgi:hypothetical protein